MRSRTCAKPHTLGENRFHPVLRLPSFSPTLPAPSEGAVGSESEAGKEGRLQGWDPGTLSLRPPRHVVPAR